MDLVMSVEERMSEMIEAHHLGAPAAPLAWCEEENTWEHGCLLISAANVMMAW